MIDNNDKIKGILQSNSLDELPLKYLPPVSDTPDNYYFISYSHLDYKYVYKDIFALQSQGVNVWYDRGMPAGISWKETAEKYIRPSRCAGVVFYISENSLLSPAIHEEIAFAKKCGKSCLTINIPLSENGKSVSAKEMLDEIISQGKEVSKEKYDFICDTFGADVLYLPYSAEADVKAEKICALKKPPLLQFTINEQYKSATVKAVNDIDVKKIEKSDFECIDPKTGERLPISSIESCAFANCKLLETVDFPEECHDIQKYAFYGCGSLKTVNFSHVYRIGESAFFDCSNLEYINLASSMVLRRIRRSTFWNCQQIKVLLPDTIKVIEDYAFAKCTGQFELPPQIESIGKNAFSDGAEVIIQNGVNYYVKNNCVIDKRNGTVILGNNKSIIPQDKSITCIGEEAFIGSSITDIEIPDNIDTLQDSAFDVCENLKNISISNNVKYIGRSCFYGCNSLEKMVISDNVLEIGESVFSYCENLKEVVIGNSIKIVPHGCFRYCTSLESVVLGSGVERLEDGVFNKCDNLKNVYMGANVKYIGRFVFNSYKATQPVNVFYAGTLAQWEKIEKAEGCIDWSSSVRFICTDGEIII